jgi:thiamine biosynthesis lipoprotein
MASDCEVLMEVDDESLASRLLHIAAGEARRIEQKFSRYRQDNIIHRINSSNGAPVEVDGETADLLDYAVKCHELSDGMFDITSGVLRKVWKFDGSDRLPAAEAVKKVLAQVGWHKVQWRRPVMILPAGMEIDLGGIGKEYAVDRAAMLLRAQSNASMVINFGGDLYITGSRRSGEVWNIGIDDPRATGQGYIGELRIRTGGLATSGDARRFLLKDGKRYGHILNPKTGWPVEDAPRSVTVVGATCMEAGMLATFAILQGKDAREFLEAQGVLFWMI